MEFNHIFRYPALHYFKDKRILTTNLVKETVCVFCDVAIIVIVKMSHKDIKMT